MFKNYSELKKYLIYKNGFKVIIFLLLPFLFSCEDQPVTVEQKGTLILNSTPGLAIIYINDSLTTLTTPNTISLEKGQYSIHYELVGYQTTRNTVVIETDQTTILNENLISITSLLAIQLIPQSEDSTLYFNYQLNKEIVLQSISVTHPTINNGNYVVYTEQFDNTPIFPSLAYRFPQLSINNFQNILGTYTFVFKGTYLGDTFEIEVGVVL